MVIQSFDPRTLQAAHTSHEDIRLVLLVENEDGPEANLERLGFTPDIYSPYFHFVNEDLISLGQEKGMYIIPWTVNRQVDILDMIRLGVDGIISDYPDSVHIAIADSLGRLQHR